MMKINIIEPFDVQSYRVIYGDTDLAGVIYYGTYMRLFEMGRNEFMRNILNLPYSHFENSGIRFPVAELYTRYVSPAFYDDILYIHTSLSKVTRKTISFNYLITRDEKKSKIALASTLHVALDRNSKTISFPEDLLNNIKKILSIT